jgi:hypothetical protein
VAELVGESFVIVYSRSQFNYVGELRVSAGVNNLLGEKISAKRLSAALVFTPFNGVVVCTRFAATGSFPNYRFCTMLRVSR